MTHACYYYCSAYQGISLSGDVLFHASASHHKVHMSFPTTNVTVIEREIWKVFIQETCPLNHVELVIKWIQ